MRVKQALVPSSPPQGITLIELMLVMGILALLAGIGWVALAPARERARQAVCMSNLRQIGRAYQMYRDDWGGMEPTQGAQWEYWALGLPPEKPPIKTLHPYLKTREVWQCPDHFLAHKVPAVNTYAPNYCTHDDEGMSRWRYGSYKYDECWLRPGGRASFRWAVSFIPDWPILICEAHHYFYAPRGEWRDTFFIGLTLPDYSVRRYRAAEYAIRLPPYRRGR